MKTHYKLIIPGIYDNRIRRLKELSRALEYGRSIRAIAKMLWDGSISQERFFMLMTSRVLAGLTRAWKMGARDVGILPGELTTKELNLLAQLIIQEESFISEFGIFIWGNRKAIKGRWGIVFNRASLWETRFLDARNQGKLNASNNPKLIWLLGSAKKHCVDCTQYDGKVKRASQWKDKGIEPQSQDLFCSGFRCTCALEPTDEPLSKGPLPNLKGKK